ncbi:MAG: flavin reductase [Gemmatimonas sp.]|nr:flavin reductase [Gemmatimonas sp.]
MQHVTLDPTTFRASLARFASGVTIVTARDRDGHDYGMTVSAFSSLSLNPPMILVCIDNGASVAPVLEHCDFFGVNILAEGQQELSRRFAEREIDRFEGVEIVRGETGVALLGGTLASLECAVTARHPAGDHTILVAEVRAAELREGNPLLYYRGAYRRLDA